MRKAKELRELSKEELALVYRELSKDIFHLRNTIQKTRKLEKPHLMRSYKRERARALTIWKEKGGTVL